MTCLPQAEFVPNFKLGVRIRELAASGEEPPPLLVVFLRRWGLARPEWGLAGDSS